MLLVAIVLFSVDAIVNGITVIVVGIAGSEIDSQLLVVDGSAITS